VVGEGEVEEVAGDYVHAVSAELLQKRRVYNSQIVRMKES